MNLIHTESYWPSGNCYAKKSISNESIYEGTIVQGDYEGVYKMFIHLEGRVATAFL